MMRGSKPGERRGGRQKGTPNKAAANRRLWLQVAGVTPKDFLLNGLAFYQRIIVEEMEKPTPSNDVLVSAYGAGAVFAKDAAPYCHSRLSAIEAKIDGKLTLESLVMASVQQRGGK